MNTYLSLLKGINVGGYKRIGMPDLSALYRNLGLENVQTYIQSGNVVFSSTDSDPVELAGKIEEGIQAQFGFSVRVLVRTQEEWLQIFQNNPFLKRDSIDTGKLHVTLLTDYPGEELSEKIRLIQSEPDEFILSGKTVYLYCPNGYGRTKFSNDFFEKKLKVEGTTRNWNTVASLLEMAKKL